MTAWTDLTGLPHFDPDLDRDPLPAPVAGRRASGSARPAFGTMTVELLALRDWLVAHGVTLVGMESTGVYWRPVFYTLEDAMECWLLNAAHMRNVPGRKTDVADAAWIAQLVEHGLVRPSFVPPPPIRELRFVPVADHLPGTRARVNVVASSRFGCRFVR